MKLEWDETKNQANIRKHGLSFADAREIFAAPILVDETSGRTMANSDG